MRLICVKKPDTIQTPFEEKMLITFASEQSYMKLNKGMD